MVSCAHSCFPPLHLKLPGYHFHRQTIVMTYRSWWGLCISLFCFFDFWDKESQDNICLLSISWTVCSHSLTLLTHPSLLLCPSSMPRSFLLAPFQQLFLLPGKLSLHVVTSPIPLGHLHCGLKILPHNISLTANQDSQSSCLLYQFAYFTWLCFINF